MTDLKKSLYEISLFPIKTSGSKEITYENMRFVKSTAKYMMMIIITKQKKRFSSADTHLA